jgi:glycerol-3-phosphate O-acyltransferase
VGEPAFSPWQGEPGRDLVFLLDHSTALERRLIEQWLAAGREDAPVASRDPELIRLEFRKGQPGRTALQRLTELCDANAEVYFVPLRVLWLPRPGKPTISTRIRELLTGDSYSPGPLRQRMTYRRDPARARPIAAEGASMASLKSRFNRQLEPGADARPEQLAGFIARQALLALQRAESQVRGARYKMPRLVAEEILARPSFTKALAEEAERSGQPYEKIESEARTCLAEMAPVHTAFAVDLMAEFGRYLYTRGFDPEIQVLPSDLARVRELGQTKPIVYLMTHKSHLDGFLLYTFFYDLDLPPVHTFGGINMSFLGLGTLGRRSGAIFIRRSFNDDPVYKLVFRHYIDYLAEKRFPLLWALEGTRSRTGKLMPPRYGLINYVVDSYARAATTDLVLMPVSIVYDQIPEVADYVAEAKGIAKRPESASWFMRYISGLHNPFGRIHVRFGQGVSLADVLGEDRESINVSRLDIQKLAFQLAVDVNNVTPVTGSAMLTYVLLAHGHRALTIGQLIGELRSLLGFLRLLDVPTASDIDLATREVLDRALSQLAHTGIVAVYEDGLEPVYAIPADAGMAAAYYKNTFVHFLVTSAIAEFAMLRAAESPAAATETSFHEEALRLRDMLKFEFFFSEKDAFLEKMDAEMDLRFDGWRTRLAEGPAGIGVVLEGIDPLLTAGTLRAFLESYLIVADALQQHGTSEPIETKSFIRHCTALGRQRVLQKRVTSIESVSRAYLESALKLAGSRGLFEGESEALQLARDEFAADLNQLVQRAERLAAIQLSRGNRDRQRPGRAI